MNNKKMLSKICVIVSVFQFLAEALTFAIIWRLDMLPDKYLIVAAALFFLLWLLVAVLLFARGRKKKGVGNVRRIIAVFLAALVIFGCAVISKMVSEFHRTMGNVSNNGGVTMVMTVYVRAEDPAQQIEDAKDYTFAIMELIDREETQQALERLQKQLDQTLSTASYSGVPKMVDALYAGEVDAILMSSARASMLEDLQKYADFPEKTRVLHEVNIALEPSPGDPSNKNGNGQSDRPVIDDGTGGQNGGNTSQTADITNTPFVVYLSGSDTSGEKLTVSRSDVNILAVVNPVTKQVLLVNTPRDYFIPHPKSESGMRDKLTHLGNSGVDCSIEGLTNLYGERVDFYVRMNFTGFEALIDAIGGVTIYSDVAFTARDTYIEVGENHFSGSQALDYARERFNVQGGDNARGKNQMKVIKSVIEKMASGAIITNYSSILDSLGEMFVTDMSTSNISKLVKMQLSDMASWNIQSYAVTGEDGSEITYSMPGEYLYVMYPYEGMVDYGSELIDRVLAGEILTEADTVYPG